MATVHAGIKRSHHEMSGLSATPGRSRPTTPGDAFGRSTTSSPSQEVDNGFPREERFRRPIFAPRELSFEPRATIALIGVRGVGKSTLGVLTATAYNRRLIDTDRAFYDAAGSSPSTYRRAHGAREYQRRHGEILRKVLDSHSTGAIIVCNFSDLEGEGIDILYDFAQSHPVIHITRDVTGIHDYLKVWSAERVQDLLRASRPRLRACTNYEYVNLSEKERTASSNHHNDGESSGFFLTLKRVERDFLKFLRNIVGDLERTSAHHSAYPFSQVGLEKRTDTLTVHVSVRDVLSGNVDLDRLQLGSDCIELDVEPDDQTDHPTYDDIASAFAIIRRSSILPILLYINASSLTGSSRQTWLYETTGFCLRLCPEICTFDMIMSIPVVKQLLDYRSHCLALGIGKNSNLTGWHDASLLRDCRQAASLAMDFFKVTLPAASAEDMFAINDFTRAFDKLEFPIRLITYATGPQGRLSQCLNRTLTTVDPPSKESTRLSIASARSSTAKDLIETRFSIGILEPLRFFLFGADVSYSVSPAMHNTSYQASGLQYSYEARSSENLDDLKEVFQRTDLGGVAVAQPYKTLILSSLDDLSPQARAIGAVNTIVPVRDMNPDGSIPDDQTIIARRPKTGKAKALYGFNTDWIGIRACVRKGLSPANAVRAPSTALICGAGGMARSALYALLSLGVKNIMVYNRTLANATTLVDRYKRLLEEDAIPELERGSASQINIQVLESLETGWPANTRAPTMIVSGIPTQKVDGTPNNFVLPDAWLKSPTGGVVLELGYRLPVSPLADQIRARAKQGWIFMNGYDMLPEQAFAQFELFTGRRAPRSVMRNEITKRRLAPDG